MKEYYIYLGTYTNKGSKGIYGMRISQEGKLMEEPQLLAEMPSPTYFYLSRDRRFLYAVAEPGEGEKGATYVYEIDPQSKALSLHSKRAAAGRGLCHITMDKQERYAVVTCYPDATVQVFPVDHRNSITPMFCLKRHSGSGPVSDRQESAHAHSAYFTPDGVYVVVCDLGIDELVLYTMNEESGKLHRAFGKNVTMPAGCGPRHMVFSPDDNILIGGDEPPTFNTEGEDMLGEVLPPRSYQRNLEELDALLGAVGALGSLGMSLKSEDDEDDFDDEDDDE